MLECFLDRIDLYKRDYIYSVLLVYLYFTFLFPKILHFINIKVD